MFLGKWFKPQNISFMNQVSLVCFFFSTGGYIVILSPRHLIDPFESSMNELADQGAWRMLNRKLVPEYLREQEGILLSFQKSL